MVLFRGDERSWFPYARRATLGLAGALAAYVAYALCVVPWLEPDTARPDANATQETPIRARAVDVELAALFPEGSWERKQPHVLRTDRGMLLFEEYRPLEGGHLELRPCTIIYFAASRSSPRGRPIVLRAPQRALLKFDADLDLVRGEVGKPVGGRLEGEITIFSPESEPGANDDLEISTRTIQIDRQRIWTTHDVAFRMGPHHGSGRNLLISLDAISRPAVTGSRAPLGSLRFIELAHLDRIHIALHGRGLLAGRESAAADAIAETPVTVTCQGRVIFDVPEMALRLEEHVLVVREAGAGRTDQLRCDSVALHWGLLADRPPGTVKRQPAEASAPPWQMHRLVARGSPVELEAQSEDTLARGEELEYDFGTRRIRLAGDTGVYLRHKTYEVVAPRLEYQIPQDMGRVGQLWAPGPGRFTSLATAASPQPLVASWQREVRLQPHDQAHVFSALGGLEITMDQTGSFAADEAHVWFVEVPRPVASATIPVAPAAESRWTLQPTKMLAVGQVRANSSQLAAAADRLEAWFRSTDKADPAAGTERAGAAGLLAAPTRSEDGRPPAANPRKLDLEGKLVRLQFAYRRGQPVLEEATVDGDVRLTEWGVAAAQTPTLRISGNQLQLRLDEGEQAAVDVVGTPALVQGPGMALEGTNIHLLQRENRLWLEGPGRMNVAPPPKEGAPAVPVLVSWKGRMDFDGQTVAFDQGVTVEGTHALEGGDWLRFVVRGHRLEVGMSQRIDFQRPQSLARIALGSLAFRGEVTATNRTVDALGNQRSTEQLVMRDWVLDYTTGEFRGQGSGWLRSTRFARDSLRQPGADPAASRSEQLVHLYVEYRDGMAGNVLRREVNLFRVTRASYSPVQSWEDLPDPQMASSLGKNGIALACDRLSAAEMPGGPNERGLEMNALGNVVVEGSQFSASAMRLSYDQLKDQLVLEGDPRSHVQISRFAQAGRPASRGAASKIIYWPSTGELKVLDAREVDLFR